MALTLHTDAPLNPEILTETVQGMLAQRDALLGSPLAQSGAVVINDRFDVRDPSAIGTQVTVPYFGHLGDFVDNSDGDSVTPTKLSGTNETATVARASLAVEITRWGQHGSSGDPYQEAARQIVNSARRKMDSLLVALACNSSSNAIVVSKYSATTPAYINYDMLVDAQAFWGDEADDMVGYVINSRTKADMLKLRDADGRPLLIDSMSRDNGEQLRFMGKPCVVSDKLATTGSSMGSVTSAGTTPPSVTLSGTPSGAWDLRIKISTGGASDGTAKFQFSTNGGAIWSAVLTVPNGGGAIALTDTAADSRVGFNGASGVTATFANGTYNADNTYSATAKLKARTLLVRRASMAFWYNRQALELLTHPDILADATIAAMHLYSAPHIYRRVQGGKLPGVIALDHNVGNYVG